MSLQTNFVSTNRFGVASTNNFTGNGNKNSIAVNECYQNISPNKTNLHNKVLDTANTESESVNHAISSTEAKEGPTVNRFSSLPMNVNSNNESKIGFVNKHNNEPLKITEQQFDENKLKKYLPNAVLNNFFD